MKKLPLLLSFFLLISFDALAQTSATAVMEVKVKVIAGAKVEAPTNLYLSEAFTNSRHSKLVITSSPNSEISVTTIDKCVLKNINGETISIKTNNSIIKDSNSGVFSLLLDAKLPTSKKLNGNYKGNVVTTIEYL